MQIDTMYLIALLLLLAFAGRETWKHCRALARLLFVEIARAKYLRALGCIGLILISLGPVLYYLLTFLDSYVI